MLGQLGSAVGLRRPGFALSHATTHSLRLDASRAVRRSPAEACTTTHMTDETASDKLPMEAAAAEAHRHAWEPIEPSECDDCIRDAERYRAHVYALAATLLSDRDDDGRRSGNPHIGYPLILALYAAVQVMHQQAQPTYDARGSAGAKKSPLATAAEEHMYDLMLGVGSAGGYSDGWEWWFSKIRTSAEAREWLARAYESVPRSPARERCGRVFLLGAGFSRAIDAAMPTMAPLLRSLQDAAEAEQWPTAESFGLSEADDLETWLDSLSVPQPYRSDAENREAEGLFLRASAWIGRHLSAVQEDALGTGAPRLLENLLYLWQHTKCTVISMNYDTLVERCVIQLRGYFGLPRAADQAVNAVRAVPLPAAGTDKNREENERGTLPGAFRLAKLHGSLDWWHAGGSGRGTPILAPGYDTDKEAPHKMMGQMVPYIIPPCFTKGPMFDHEIIRENWHVARRGLESAEELVVMGYSLPSADTSVVGLLRSCAPDKITLLDTDPQLKRHYEAVLAATVDAPSSPDPISDWTDSDEADP